MTHSYIHTSVLNPVILNTNNIINLLSHPLSLSEYVWIVHSTLVTITTYTTDGSDYIYLCVCPVISDERKTSMSDDLDDPCIWPGFPTSYVMVFILFSVSERWEAIVRFIDIDGIVDVDHHWLNFLFINIYQPQRIQYKRKKTGQWECLPFGNTLLLLFF